MKTRRDFIKTSGAGIAGFIAINQLGLLSACNQPQILNFGFIAGIVREEMKTDWKTTLAKAAEYGFKEIETGAPPAGVSVDEFLTYCNEVGLTLVAGGVPMNEDMDVLRNRLDELSKLGVQYAVNYWPWFGGGPFMMEDCKRSAPILNSMGEICSEYNIQFCWHNHDKEFFDMEEGNPFDYLMENTDPDLVKCELDVFWAAKGGADPLETLKKYQGRYPILHLKDMTADDERTFECVGQGIVDFPAILKEANRQKIKHFMVEHDTVVDGLECLRTSAQYLKSIKV